MEDKQIIFIISSSGERTNIMSNFKVLSLEEFVSSAKEIVSKNYYYENFRYAYLGGVSDNMKNMRLSEFNEVFKPNTFTPEEVTKIFRKEISEEYGLHKERSLLKKLSNKELVRGGVYLDNKGHIQIFLGKVVRNFYRNEVLVNTEQGNGWYYIAANNVSAYQTPEVLMKGCAIIKGYRPCFSFTGNIIELPEKVSRETAKNFYTSYNRTEVTELI